MDFNTRTMSRYTSKVLFNQSMDNVTKSINIFSEFNKAFHFNKSFKFTNSLYYGITFFINSFLLFSIFKATMSSY